MAACRSLTIVARLIELKPIEIPLTTQAEDTELSVSTNVQTLLSGNSRLNLLNLAGGVFVFLVGLGIACFGGSWGLRVFGMLVAFCVLPVVWYGWQIYSHPRLAISDRELLVYLRPNYRQPFRVPLTVVEVFFIGQGAVSGSEPGQPKEYQGAVAANVIVRLADAATDWHKRDVHLWLGVWDEGYITVRGLFCENIDHDVLKRMNKQLLRRKRELRDQQAT